MTSPPQPYRPRSIDLDLGIEAALPPPKRQTANERHRQEAERLAEYQRWRVAMIEDIWGKP
jgi:hypothetical protein